MLGIFFWRIAQIFDKKKLVGGPKINDKKKKSKFKPYTLNLNLILILSVDKKLRKIRKQLKKKEEERK